MLLREVVWLLIAPDNTKSLFIMPNPVDNSWQIASRPLTLSGWSCQWCRPEHLYPRPSYPLSGYDVGYHMDCFYKAVGARPCSRFLRLLQRFTRKHEH
jgi:hypothetical protein